MLHHLDDRLGVANHDITLTVLTGRAPVTCQVETTMPCTSPIRLGAEDPLITVSMARGECTKRVVLYDSRADRSLEK